jgi:NADH-quinone oxidoreductase subunit E
MPLLYLAQRDDNYVSPAELADIAQILDMSITDVASVVGFYTLYYDRPGGRYRIQVCTDLPCALRGAETFLQALCAEMGIAPGETTADGLFTIEEVKCLAACHRAPMFQVQGDGDIAYHENQSAETALQVIAALREKVAQELRQNEEAA